MSTPINVSQNITDKHKQELRQWLKQTSGWQWFTWIHNIRVRWRWILSLLLIVAFCLWIFGIEHMKHVTLAMAIEQVLHVLGSRAVDVVEISE